MKRTYVPESTDVRRYEEIGDRERHARREPDDRHGVITNRLCLSQITGRVAGWHVDETVGIHRKAGTAEPDTAALVIRGEHDRTRLCERAGVKGDHPGRQLPNDGRGIEPRGLLGCYCQAIVV
jgi:hypothetical protein